MKRKTIKFQAKLRCFSPTKKLSNTCCFEAHPIISLRTGKVRYDVFLRMNNGIRRRSLLLDMDDLLRLQKLGELKEVK